METPKAPWWIGFPASVGFALMGTVAPTFLSVWVQALLFALGGIAVLWSASAGAWHFGLLGKKLRTSSDKRVTFAEIVRRAAFETEWALDYEPSSYGWFRDLQRQVLDPFSTGQLEATGLYTYRNRPDATAITTILASFWANAKFTVEFALASHQDVLVFDNGTPCAAIAEEITILETDLDRIWPKARSRKGRSPAIRDVIIQWKAEQEDMLPDRLEWTNYVENQQRWERVEKQRNHSYDTANLAQIAAVVAELLSELAERTRYAGDVRNESGARLNTWRTKVSEESQGLYEDGLKTISSENLSHTQIAALSHARRRVSDFNANTIRLARNGERDAEYVANLFLQRAGETRNALVTLQNACKDPE